MPSLEPLAPEASDDSGYYYDLLPRYVRIADTLQNRIRSGEYPVGCFLPGETDLSGEFAVSRSTIRQGIGVLQQRGFVQPEMGRGTRVLRLLPRNNVVHFTDFNEDVRRSGRTPSTRLLRREVVSASAEVAVRLHIPESSKIIRIVRLRLADNSPVVYEMRALALKTCPSLLEEDLENQSIHHLMLVKYAIPLTKLELVIERVPLEGEAAEHLGVVPGTDGVYLDRLTYQSDNAPVTWYRAFYHSDHFDLTVHH